MGWHIKDYRLVSGFIFFLLIMILLPTMAFSGLLLEGRLQPTGNRTATSMDKNVTLTLRLFDDEFSGRMLYAETQKVHADTKISLNLGRGQTLEGRPDTGLTPDKLWLEVTIGDAVMNPRLNLAELETSYDLRSDTGWTMADTDLRGVGNSTLTIDNDGITIDEVKTPLTLSGSVGNNGTIQATNTAFSGKGIYGEATEAGGYGFYGMASDNGGTNTGGFFEAKGGAGSAGVRGSASNTGSGITNYGGRFSASGSLGRGVYGSASGASGRGVYGEASGSAGYGVCGKATNSSSSFTNYGGHFTADAGLGRGVYGEATATGAVTNYGGYFEANGNTGRGVYAESAGISGIGVYGRANGESGHAFHGLAYATGPVTNYGGYFAAKGDSGRGVYGSAMATGDVTNYGGNFSANGDSGVGVYGLAAATENATNYGGYFVAQGDTGRGVYGSGKAYSFYAGGSGTDFGPFTGAHDVRLEVDVADEIRPGMIVVCTGLVEVREDDDGRPCLSSTLPTVTLAAKAADKKVFGVLVKECPLPKNHWYEATDDEHFGIVNALGEGLVWVCDINGKIEAGDCITSSTVPGYGQLQDDDFIHSYTLGKATADIDWDSVTNTVEYNGRKVKVYLIPVVYTSG